MIKKKFSINPLYAALSPVLMAALLPFNAYAADEGETEDEKDAERIFVTGSRIARTEFNNEQPVEILAVEDYAAAGIKNVGDLLRSITVASGSPQITAATSTEFVVNGGDGVQTVGLRGMGANRTLVLLNGRRAGPAGVRGSVASFDFNVLPISIVERVEILKDGASSLYGSDAVAGVINIITKKGDDSEVNVYTSQPQDEGGENSRASITWGKTFDGGSFRVALDVDKQTELARGQRDYFTCGRRNIYNPQTGANIDPIDPRTGQPHCFDLLWGHVWIYDYQNNGNVPTGALAQFDYDGHMAGDTAMDINRIPNAYDAGNPDAMYSPAGWYFVRHDRLSDSYTDASHPFQDQQSLIPEMSRNTIYAQGDLQLGSSVTGYSELLLSRRKMRTNSYLQFWSYIYSETHSFDGNGDMVEIGGNPLAAGWGGAQWLSPLSITDHADYGNTVDYGRMVVGATGFVGNWTWDGNVQVSRSEGIYWNDDIYGDRIWDQNWLFGSCVGMTHADGTACQDIPWFDPEFLRGNISQGMRDYLFTQQKGKTIYDQWSADFSVGGELIEMPAGPLEMATGVHLRKDKIDDTPGQLWLDANTWHGNASSPTRGEDTTKAVFVETKIPILEGLPAVESLVANLSARYTDSDVSSSATTYKAGLNWAIGGGVNVRISKGTSFRAPALFELFLQNEKSFVAQRNLDPCINWGQGLIDGDITQRIADNCANGGGNFEGLPSDFGGGAIAATVITGGGAGTLKPETSEAFTYGLVWNSTDDKISVSVDYFDFLVEEEVSVLSADTIVYECYNSVNFPSDPLCDLFSRQGQGSQIYDNRIEPVNATYINIAKQSNRGIDFALDFSEDMMGGTFHSQLRYTKQLESSREILPGNFEEFNGQFGDPKETGTLNFNQEWSSFSLNWNIMYFGPVSNVASNGGNLGDYRGEDILMDLENGGVSYHALSATSGLGMSDWEFTLGIANLTDKRPPKVTTYRNDIATVGDAAFYSQYDFIGRRFFIDVTYKF